MNGLDPGLVPGEGERVVLVHRADTRRGDFGRGGAGAGKRRLQDKYC
jgi:hypothetical protein